MDGKPMSGARRPRGMGFKKVRKGFLLASLVENQILKVFVIN